jgi:rhomboid protease GluP
MIPRPGAPPPPLFRAPVPMAKPLWTYVLLGILAVIWLASELTGGSTNPAHMIENFGANYAPLVTEGQYWRLITANFIHWGITHLAFNAYALYSLGTQVESLFGPRRFLALYLLTGVSGAWLSYLIHNGLSGGASTSIYGLFGAIAVYFYKHRNEMGETSRAVLTNLGVTLLINLALTFAPGSNIDLWGHLGGFIGGLVLGWFLAPRYETTDSFTFAFGDILPGNRRAELANSQITDVNSLARQAVTVAVFAIALIALTVGVAMLRQSGA